MFLLLIQSLGNNNMGLLYTVWCLLRIINEMTITHYDLWQPSGLICIYLDINEVSSL